MKAPRSAMLAGSLMALLLVAGVAPVAQAAQPRVTIPAAQVAPSPPCGDVLIIGARGSGERGPGTPGWRRKADDPLGLGPTVNTAYQRVKWSTDIKRQRLSVISVDYPAKKVVSFDFVRKIDEYFTGLSQGVDYVDRALQARQESCGAERIVLAGYSQGAMVMHRVLLRYLRTSPSRERIAPRIDAALLIGDGDRLTDDNVHGFGTMHADRQGIGHYYRSISGSSTTRLPYSFFPRALEVCNSKDPVCDPNGRVPDLRGLPEHSGYSDSLALSDAADRVVQLLRVPIPATSPSAPAPTVTSFPVMNTSETQPDGVFFRRSPRSADTDRVTGHGVYANDRIDVRCYAWGEAVGPYGNRVWYQATNRTRPTVPGSGAPNSGYLNTHYVADGRSSNSPAPGVPACS